MSVFEESDAAFPEAERLREIRRNQEVLPLERYCEEEFAKHRATE